MICFNDTTLVLEENKENSQQMFLRIFDDAMEDEIYNGDTVVIDKTINILDSKNIFLFENTYEELLLSRCSYENGNIKLKFKNKSCNNITYKKNELKLRGMMIGFKDD